MRHVAHASARGHAWLLPRSRDYARYSIRRGSGTRQPPAPGARPRMTSNEAGTCDWLTTEIAVSHLVERNDLDPVVAAFQADNPYADATALAEHLVKLGAADHVPGDPLARRPGPRIGARARTSWSTSLGTGSMGTVYKALGRADRKPYAVKVLPVRGPWNVRQARKKLQQFPEETHPAVRAVAGRRHVGRAALPRLAVRRGRDAGRGRGPRRAAAAGPGGARSACSWPRPFSGANGTASGTGPSSRPT